ncbi:predicted permease [Vibrio variabilis]|uniref:Predicted permease n=1 Tax=Vibrio variabilis TaxID=990271 RepID=A0ABQ0J5G4_9VIBR|nr:predicted permease [Vibrio variabilis]
MWMAGFPGLFWGTMMGFASFIPVVGTALIWIPATAYLLITGDTGWGLFLAIWSIAVVALSIMCCAHCSCKAVLA